MMRKTTIVIAAIMVAGLVSAQEKTKLPSVEDVLTKHAKAIGGMKTFLKHDSRVLEGTMSMPSAGITGDFKLSVMKPNKTLVEVEIEGIGTIREGYDGTVAWSTNPMSGPAVKTGDQLAQTEDQSHYDGAFFPAKYYKTREVVDKVEFAGKQAWKVHFVSKNDNESYAYFDVDSGLQIGTEMTQKTPMGDLPITATMSDYQEFDGVMIPMHVEQDMGPAGKQIMKFSNITSGGVEPSVFALPPEIVALQQDSAGE